MTQQSRDKARRKKSAQYDQDIQEICQIMIDSDQTVTAREIARKVGISASSITRDPIRMSLIDSAKTKQGELRSWRKRQAKQSRNKDAESLADRDIRIAELEKQNELLIASHKAMILSVGEIGGMEGWRRFFPHWGEVENLLRDMKAMPTAEIKKLRTD